MFRRIAFLVATVVAIGLLFTPACDFLNRDRESPVGVSPPESGESGIQDSGEEREELEGVGQYNSFPWSWNLPFKGCAYMKCGPGCYLHSNNDYWATDWSGKGAAYGQPVLAPASGWVMFAGWSSSRNWEYGNQVIVEAGDTGQGNGNRYLYRVAHLSRVSVKAGWWVNKGTILGYVGSTGKSTGAHLHFSVHRGQYGGYGGLYCGSMPISNCWYPGIDGYNGSGYWCSEFK